MNENIEVSGLQFIYNDYGICDLNDLPIPHGIYGYLPQLTRLSTASIERLIEWIPFLEFEYGCN